ncbi:hypothetical protein [Haloarchaeobius sp. HME9146]|uniref:hypothetical protein n=1 Tax=Haloarchaeobius sp. HME9146 TaxID=2978732 RepID=UPI0021C11AF0|nr:hypothetical protein [Haloarchaeobius sp. HME9146]MCT9096989.1 hypothetical protein [Haloarchaeobius sp. HME9146]
MSRLSRLLTVVLLGSVALATPASAHGNTSAAPPIPAWLLFLSAGGAVAVTAVVVSRMDAVPTAVDDVLVSVPARAGEAVRWVARTVFLVGFLAAIYTGLTGPQTPKEFATVFVWPVWFKGLLVVSAVVGSPWRSLSPWETLYDLLARLEGEDPSLLAYPAGLGTWPAAFGFLVLIGFAENLSAVPTSPRLTAVTIALYATVMLVGGVVWGRDWFANADPLAAFYRLVGRVAPLSIRRGEGASGADEADGADTGDFQIVQTSPWKACSEALPDRGAAALAVAAVYTVSFDGLEATPEYQGLNVWAAETVGLGVYASLLLYVVGFFAFLGVFWLVVRLAAALGEGDVRRATLAFGATLLPIAVGYDLAHNYPYVLRSLLAFVEVTTQQPVVATPLAIVPPQAIWGTEVLLVVVGHVAAVLAAHTVSLRVFGSLDLARRGHAPVVVLMLGYTVLSLWVFSRPVVSTVG